MNLVEQSEYYKIYWHDDDETILIGEVYVGWTWEVAYTGLRKLNEIIGIRAQEINV